MSLTSTRILVTLLVAASLTSCSASQHAGVANIQEPPLTDSDESHWFLYYQDQLDALSGNVLAPDSRYPNSARTGYGRAKDEWNKQADHARGRTMLVYISGGLVVGAATIYVIAVLSSHNARPVVD